MLVFINGHINGQLSRTKYLGCTLPAQPSCMYTFSSDCATSYVLAMSNLLRQNIKSDNLNLLHIHNMENEGKNAVNRKQRIVRVQDNILQN
jgi:hypothetical protein